LNRRVSSRTMEERLAWGEDVGWGGGWGNQRDSQRGDAIV